MPARRTHRTNRLRLPGSCPKTKPGSPTRPSRRALLLRRRACLAQGLERCYDASAVVVCHANDLSTSVNQFVVAELPADDRRRHIMNPESLEVRLLIELDEDLPPGATTLDEADWRHVSEVSVSANGLQEMAAWENVVFMWEGALVSRLAFIRAYMSDLRETSACEYVQETTRTFEYSSFPFDAFESLVLAQVVRNPPDPPATQDAP